MTRLITAHVDIHSCAAYGRCYLENTKSEYLDMEMYDVWAVDREGEAQRFAAHDKLSNRKLLWHGTNGDQRQPFLSFLPTPLPYLRRLGTKTFIRGVCDVPSVLWL